MPRLELSMRFLTRLRSPSRSLLLRIKSRQSRRKKQRLKSPKPRKKLLPKSRKLSKRRKKPSAKLQRRPRLILRLFLKVWE